MVTRRTGFTPMNPLGEGLAGLRGHRRHRPSSTGTVAPSTGLSPSGTYLRSEPSRAYPLALPPVKEYYDLWESFGRLFPPIRLWPGEAPPSPCPWIGIKGPSKRLGDRVFTISDTVGARLTRWEVIPAAPLYPPAPERAYRTEGYEKSIFAVSRLVSHKRVGWVIELSPTWRTRMFGCGSPARGRRRREDRARVQELGLTDPGDSLGPG